MLSTAARRAASIAFHRTASGKATRRQLKYQRTSKGKAMNIAARRRMSDLMFPTGKMVFFIKRVPLDPRSEEHTSELQSLMRISYAVFCVKKKNRTQYTNDTHQSAKDTNKEDKQNQ